MIDLEAIKARCNAATPGPWEPSWDWSYDDFDGYSGYGQSPATSGKSLDDIREQSCANADFIAHAREDILALVAEVEQLRAYADRLAAGLPEGMLPKDIENIKLANWKLAEENTKLRAVYDALLEAYGVMSASELENEVGRLLYGGGK